MISNTTLHTPKSILKIHQLKVSAGFCTAVNIFYVSNMILCIIPLNLLIAHYGTIAMSCQLSRCSFHTEIVPCRYFWCLSSLFNALNFIVLRLCSTQRQGFLLHVNDFSAYGYCNLLVCHSSVFAK